MRGSALRRGLRRTLRGLLIASGAASAACGGPDLSLFEEPRCSPSGRNTPALDGVRAAIPVDYVELRVYPDYAAAAPADVLAQIGTPCEKASHQSACIAALVALRSGIGVRADCGTFCTFYYFAATQGDKISAINSKEEFAAYLGPIDAQQEALWVAWAAGYDFVCGDRSRGAVRAVPGGYELIALRSAGCGADLYQTELLVNGNGALTEHSAQRIGQSEACQPGP